jgi:hypothetical protein
MIVVAALETYYFTDGEWSSSCQAMKPRQRAAAARRVAILVDGLSKSRRSTSVRPLQADEVFRSRVPPRVIVPRTPAAEASAATADAASASVVGGGGGGGGSSSSSSSSGNGSGAVRQQCSIYSSLDNGRLPTERERAADRSLINDGVFPAVPFQLTRPTAGGGAARRTGRETRTSCMVGLSVGRTNIGDRPGRVETPTAARRSVGLSVGRTGRRARVL